VKYKNIHKHEGNNDTLKQDFPCFFFLLDSTDHKLTMMNSEMLHLFGCFIMIISLCYPWHGYT